MSKIFDVVENFLVAASGLVLDVGQRPDLAFDFQFDLMFDYLSNILKGREKKNGKKCGIKNNHHSFVTKVSKAKTVLNDLSLHLLFLVY